jgi:hypothetical protein
VRADSVKGLDCPLLLGFQRMETMAKDRSTASRASGRFAGVRRRRDAAVLSKRHDISRQLIRIWVGKYEASRRRGSRCRQLAKIAAVRKPAVLILTGRGRADREFKVTRMCICAGSTISCGNFAYSHLLGTTAFAGKTRPTPSMGFTR